MTLPEDYTEKVYAGVLGKIIGVYLGRPFENWTHEKIASELGEVHYYVNGRRDLELKNHTLVVTDDDISGTFAFLQALPDHGNNPGLSPEQIGQTWLNYIIERRAILWWGGMGNSTEHTAYVRLKGSVRAPESGSAALNGKIVSEQIGAQIFIDGWAMVAPGDPELAASLASRAASVSHDGEAIHGAQVIAAMEAQAFVEPELDKLLDVAVSLIPKSSVIYRVIDDLREWRVTEDDWRACRRIIEKQYGYHKYGGNGHIVPNHALVMLGLLYGEDNFQHSLMITNTSGWDTDCNSGNVGCLLGIKNGLTAINHGPDWRGPVADRMYLPTADGGRAITDAVTESYKVVNIGRALSGEPRLHPKDGARFHFEMPGSVQGFQVDDDYDCLRKTSIKNVPGHSEAGERSLAILCDHLAPGQVARVHTPTFIPPEARTMTDYLLLASPTLYPGQTVRAQVSSAAQSTDGVACRLFVRHYGAGDKLVIVRGPEIGLEPGESRELEWCIEPTGGQPVAQVGLEVTAERPVRGAVYLDYLTWNGMPRMRLGAPKEGGSMWRRAWVCAVDRLDSFWPEPYRLVQNRGRGMIIQGAREWTDYEVRAPLNLHMTTAAGVACRVQGLGRYYALLLNRDGTLRLIKELEGARVLAETDFPWSFGDVHEFSLCAAGSRLEARMNGNLVFEIEDVNRPLKGGAAALVCEEGRVMCDAVEIRPADHARLL